MTYVYFIEIKGLRGDLTRVLPKWEKARHAIAAEPFHLCFYYSWFDEMAGQVSGCRLP